MDYASQPQRVPYILDEFGYFWETPFDTTDPNFQQCTIDRPRILPSTPAWYKAGVEQRMYIVNHYLDTKFAGVEVPDRRDAGKTNAADGNPSSIMTHVRLCEKLHGGNKPSVVLVDYFDRGSVKKAEAALNGLE
ncbi:uncharacterized protein KY384_003538 [Bacidia gigantensis]|uniref:uncharacterized protein n=1 Tax=Bacidia gigantensis TaxID=2732470 RepID=UPI001D03FB72|nr:uncharacterized protein KY384_003538 [Bacidia gigantensis]KAG8531902.1 hypothetical protein KY384_003538 [Bacidia gigantensis]